MQRTIRTTALATLISLPGLLLSGTSFGEDAHYRWINERGNEVHSDRPPPAGTDYEVISSGTGLKRVVTADEGAVPADVTPSASNDFTQLDETEANRDKKNPELCERARSNLESLSGARRIVMRDESGEQRILTPEEIAEEKTKAESLVDVYCE